MWPIKTVFHYHRTEIESQESFFEKDLHLFITDPNNSDQNIQIFKRLFSMRTRKSQEHWLVDISSWTANLTKDYFADRLRFDFEGLQLDLDDDLYLYQSKLTNQLREFLLINVQMKLIPLSIFSEQEDLTMLWEMYEIYPTLPSKVNYLGYWNAKQGLQYEEPRKWVRRQNLEVKKLITFQKQFLSIIHCF